MTPHEFRVPLRQALLGAERVLRKRDRRRRLAVRGAAVLVAVLVVAVGLFVVARPEPTAADVEVLQRDGFTFVRLTDLVTRAAAVRSALSKAGLDVTVDSAPVGPSNVGQFLTLAGEELPPQLTVTNGTASRFAGFKIPADWTGRLTLTMGRAARAGETWRASSDALAPHEALACRDLLGATAAEISRTIAQLGLSSRWLLVGPTAGEATPAQAASGEYASWRAIRIEAVSPSEVWVTMTADGSWPYPPSVPRPRLDPSC